jgi:hypothetical protein
VKLIELEADAVAVDNNTGLPLGTCAKLVTLEIGVIVVIQ